MALSKNYLRRIEIFIIETVHHRNIQSLVIGPYKVKENLSNTIMNDILQTRTLPYNLRSNTDFTKSFVNTIVVLV